MPRYIQTPDAEQDAIDVWHYIATDSIAAADNWLAMMIGKYQMLAQYPKLGTIRRVKKMKFRTYAAGRYLIFFREIEDGVEIMRIIHGARHWPKLL